MAELYKKVPTDLNFIAREEEVLSFWRDTKLFEKAVKAGEGKPEWTFYDGPPTANGKPHIGHILTRCIKDLFPRYWAMKGYNVMRKAGWDTHGLPVELEVERQLGLDGKEQIERYGVREFIAKCKESVWKYKSEWEEMSERVGFFADMVDPYITYKDDYIESIWWSVSEIHKKGLLYKGHKVVPYCPRCGTALSSHEVAQGYKDVVDTSVFVKFESSEPNTYYLAWTTTPWTLPSNVCMTVNAKETYCKVAFKSEYLIMAKALVENVIGEGAEIVDEFPGKSLEYNEYKPLFGEIETDKKGWFITCDPYVTLSDGSGIVHSAPAFGEEDARVGKKYNLPFIQLVKPDGTFDETTKWNGVFVKDADKLIIEELRERGLLFLEMPFEHSYPFCWRCDTPLLYYARSTWFIAMTKVRDTLIAANRSVNWLPENIKEGRMGNFVENVIDWGVSRERYWGTPLPIWTCDCGHLHVVGSRAELYEMGIDTPAELELHKPFIDEVHLKCEKCGGVMTRVPEVMDCWYDSGSMPFAQWHYPFENKEEFERRFPANFISEAVDQTRGWFYTLLAISTLIFEKSSFENCIVLGHVQDKDGKKMSKHLGNVVGPWDVLNSSGADAVRWYFFSNSAPWLPSRFYPDAVSESQRKFMGTLWNTYAFYVLYANIDGFNPTKYSAGTVSGNVMDKWILSRLNSLIKSVRAGLDEYKIYEPTKDLNKFVDELSNWYVRRCRERFWGSEMKNDKISAYMTLYTVLENLIRIIAPFTPFIAETIYQNLVLSNNFIAPESVHLCAYPECDESLIDTQLEENMGKALAVVVLGRSCRSAANIKNRQPIGTMYIGGVSTLPEMFLEVIKGELNVKKIALGAAANEYITYIVKPQLKTLGPKYGKLLGAIREHLSSSDGGAIVAAVADGGTFSFNVADTKIELSFDDLIIEPKQKEGYAVQTEGEIAVILDTELTPELTQEGYVRELVSKIQTMRKESGFEVTDHIVLTIGGDDELMAVAEKYSEAIAGDVLADKILFGYAQNGKEWDINGRSATIAVTKA